MPDDVAEALDYVLENDGWARDWELDGPTKYHDKDYVALAKLLAEWVKENCK